MPAPAHLHDVLEQVWAVLAEGAARRDSPFHQGVFATLSGHGPEARYVVLRHAERERARLTFHTDRRSPKIAQLQNDPRASWCFFGDSVQLRFAGRAMPMLEGQYLEAAWQHIPGFDRHFYHLKNVPGTPLFDARGGLSEEVSLPMPEAALVDPGRLNFAAVEFHLERIDWLHLARGGHRRAQFESADGWRGRWVQP